MATRLNRNTFQAEYTRVNRRFEVQFLPRITRAVRRPVLGLVAVLRSSGDPQVGMRYINNIGPNEALARAVRELYRTVGMRHARMNYSRLLLERQQTKAFGFDAVWQQFILNYLERFLTEKITWTVSETLRTAMLRHLDRMIVNGDSIDQMIEYFTEWDRPRYQASRIVRTETNRAANVGAKAQASTDQYQQVKEWISAEDNWVRGLPHEHANHRKLDGTVLDENEYFIDSRNGDRLQQPGDPLASAASTVNCRCSAAFTYKRDAQGNLIPKRRSTVVILPS